MALINVSASQVFSAYCNEQVAGIYQVFTDAVGQINSKYQLEMPFARKIAAAYIMYQVSEAGEDKSDEAECCRLMIDEGKPAIVDVLWSFMDAPVSTEWWQKIREGRAEKELSIYRR